MAAWARFEMDGVGTDPDGKVVTRTGTFTLSSVGTCVVDGRKCRWIEVTEDGKSDGKAYTSTQKLLIPEDDLAKGKEPLRDVLKAWTKDSADGNNAREIADLDGAAGQSYLQNSFAYILHGPFNSESELPAARIESKLGALECNGIAAFERTIVREIGIESSYTIRLHEKAPFGVVSWEVETKVKRAGQLISTGTLKLKLIDFGNHAKSAIPEAE